MKFDCEKCGKIDVELIDGYHIADRLLEGVMFEVRRNEDGTCIVNVVKKHAAYFNDLNTVKWLGEAKAYAERNWHDDIFTCPRCKRDVVPDDLLA